MRVDHRRAYIRTAQQLLDGFFELFTFRSSIETRINVLILMLGLSVDIANTL